MLIVGWQLARDLGRALAPTLFRRLEPGAAGTVGFIARFVTVAIAVFIALHVAGLDPRTLAARRRRDRGRSSGWPRSRRSAT